MKSHHLPIRYTDDPTGHEAKWEQHIMVVLWIGLAFMIMLALALVFAEGNGLLQSTPEVPLPSLPYGF